MNKRLSQDPTWKNTHTNLISCILSIITSIYVMFSECSRVNKLFLNIIGGPVCPSFKSWSFIASLFSAALRYSQTASKQRASTYHSPFHLSCPHSRCHGHRPNGQECSADYHNETRSPCTRVELRGNMKTEIKRRGIKRFIFCFY